MKCVVHDNGDVIKRLNRTEGQIRGIKAMVEENRPCEDVLVQISAVNSALHRIAQMVLEDHLGHCVETSVQTGDTVEAIQELKRAVQQFSNIK